MQYHFKFCSEHWTEQGVEKGAEYVPKQTSQLNNNISSGQNWQNFQLISAFQGCSRIVFFEAIQYDQLGTLSMADLRWPTKVKCQIMNVLKLK